MAARQLLPHAGGVEVVSPASLRELMAAKARAILATYASAGPTTPG
jgi:predicted DNA-binding transcriptional regulator YafY